MRKCLWCEHGVPGEDWLCPRCGVGPEGGEIPIFAPALIEDAGGGYPLDTYELWPIYEQRLAYWFRPRAQMIAWALKHYFPGARSFFDAGCGAGSVLEAVRVEMPAIDLTGADASPQALELAGQRVGGLSVLQMDATRIPFRDHFDAVGSFDVLEHLDDDHEALAELVASVVPGGGVLITVPQHPWLWSAEDDAGGHKRRYRRRQLLDLLEGAGLRVQRTTSYVFTLLPAMAAVRMRRRRISPEAALEQARQAAPGSAVMERILHAEVAAIRRGVSFPFGGSLFVVAQRERG